MKKLFLIAIVAGSIGFSSMPARSEILMGLSESCGVPASLWQIEIWNPPGGYAQVNEDYSFTVDVNEGHKLIASTKCLPPPGGGNVYEGCPKDGRGAMIGSDWTPAKEGSVLKVQCGR